jgi:hypothetical protein
MVIRAAVKIKWEVRTLFWRACKGLEAEEVKDKAPIPPTNSVHPWSNVWRDLWEISRGRAIIFWLERGVKCHIVVKMCRFKGGVRAGVAVRVNL